MYYDVLGLEQGATQAEIKKAYFSLVRKHSPEKDPEKFREIREAYEHLKSAADDQGPVFKTLTDPWASKFLKQIQTYQKSGDDKLVRDACEEAWRAFPNEIQFLYLLVKAQRKAGNTGKAVKSGEELIKKEPDNKWFWRELAISYQERGYTRKAFLAFDKAYELGCRDSEFVLEFSLSCNDYRQYDKGIAVLEEFIGRERRWQREEIPQVIEAYTGLVTMYTMDNKSPVSLMEQFKEFLQQYSLYVDENLDILAEIMTIFAVNPHMAGQQEHSVILEIIDIFEKSCRSDEGKAIMQMLRKSSHAEWIYQDSRLSDTLHLGAEAYFMMDDTDSELQTYAVLDFKLCMIEERKDILPQLEIIEKEYPLYYEKIKDFAEQIKNEKNLEYLRSNMLKKYKRMAQYVGGGVYFEKYPQEKARQMGTVIYENEFDTPYVRSDKKIGRNDPCPCGSGKKYKHCCMRKNL